ncbi:hypothetical protein JMUB7518_27940 [Staphylococcus aureus]
MYTFSKKNAINDLEENPLIKSVEIHKQLPNTLNVDITENEIIALVKYKGCLLYTSDAADELDGVDLGGRRIIKK